MLFCQRFKQSRFDHRAQILIFVKNFPFSWEKNSLWNFEPGKFLTRKMWLKDLFWKQLLFDCSKVILIPWKLKAWKPWNLGQTVSGSSHIWGKPYLGQSVSGSSHDWCDQLKGCFGAMRCYSQFTLLSLFTEDTLETLADHYDREQRGRGFREQGD